MEDGVFGFFCARIIDSISLYSVRVYMNQI